VARFVVAGVGVVGARAARQVFALGDVDDLVIVGSQPQRSAEIAAALGEPARTGSWDDALAAFPEAVVLAGPTDHAQRARAALGLGAHVVSVAAGEEDVRDLLELDAEAARLGRSVVVGAGFSPGLSCLLAVHGAATLDSVEELRVAVAGTAGRACTVEAATALSGRAFELDGGEPVSKPAGGGRELCWFPDPVGPLDCYRYRSGSPLLLQPAFSSAGRISARRAASRAELLAARAGWRQALPWQRNDQLGAIRVELDGRVGEALETRILGAVDRPAVAAGAVAGVAAHWAVEGRLARPGAGGLASMVSKPVPFLNTLSERGVRAAAYGG
jgi:hypothetical protein